jgi:2-polyprenyl-6-methoxyphenol hydroxylase-like FAD-dependent oxidoreductase
MESPDDTPSSRSSIVALDAEYDVAILGAGPVGLAMAIELSRLGLTALVLDRRPPPAEDPRLRAQLLVARAGDLANLEHVGIDIDDPRLVSVLATRCERDVASGRAIVGDVVEPPLERTTDLWELAAQRPLALLPIGRLQQALAARAQALGAVVRHLCEVTRLRRHNRVVSLVCADGTSVRAALAIVATGASRALVDAAIDAPVQSGPAQRLIAGVFDVATDEARWTRLELLLPGTSRRVRCTLLETATDADAGTALLVDPRLVDGTPEQVFHAAFRGVTRVLGLDHAPVRAAPQVFATAATSLSRRVVAGDGRAPVLVAGDAAQTGHVFSGQTCFVNVALALDLCAQLRHARDALRDRKVNAPPLVKALTRIGNLSETAASVLAHGSQRHQVVHAAGEWALAGVARVPPA